MLAPLVAGFAPTWLISRRASTPTAATRSPGSACRRATTARSPSGSWSSRRPGTGCVMLEGGYDLQALADSTAAALASLEGLQHHPEEPTKGGPGHQVVDAARHLWREAGLV